MLLKRYKIIYNRYRYIRKFINSANTCDGCSFDTISGVWGCLYEYPCKAKRIKLVGEKYCLYQPE